MCKDRPRDAAESEAKARIAQASSNPSAMVWHEVRSSSSLNSEVAATGVCAVALFEPGDVKEMGSGSGMHTRKSSQGGVHRTLARSVRSGRPKKTSSEPSTANVSVIAGSHSPHKRTGAGRDALRTGANTVDMLTGPHDKHAIGPINTRSTVMQVLLLDEDEAVLAAIAEIARQMGFVVHAFRSADRAEVLLERQTIDIVLMDLKSLKRGLATLDTLRSRLPRVPIVVMTAFATVHSAVDAMRRGASDYLTKPFGIDDLTDTLKKAAQQREFDLESRRLRERLQSDMNLGGIIGTSSVMQRLLRMASKVAYATHPVLIVGESGTGKERIAAAIHQAAAEMPAVELPAGSAFLPVDCSALSSAMLETELFGYVRGEGTAEREEHRGLLTLQSGGTLYLDAVSEMPLDLQAKLLRALQDRRVRPAGAASALPVTVRVIAASSRNLPELVDHGAFRKDLYFRLNVVNLHVPPLRERAEDIPLLAEHFLQKCGRQYAASMSLSLEVSRVLKHYAWPGNVRELEGIMERACSMSSGPVIHLIDLPSQLQDLASDAAHDPVRVDARRPNQKRFFPDESDPEREEIVSIADMERQAILATLRKLNGDKLMAAKLLGIGKTTLYRKLKEYGIDE